MEPSTSKRSWPGGVRISVLLVALVAIAVALYSFFFSLPPATGMIDTHTHYVPPFYSDLLLSKGITAGGRTIPKWNATDHLAFMDSLNIQLSVVSVSMPGARLTSTDVEEGRKLARELNEYGHMLAVTYPERFQFFATLTLPDVEGSVAEAIYALDTLKAAGVVLLASSHGLYLGSSTLDPLMEVLNARATTVFIHPSTLDVEPVKNVDKDGNEEFVVDPMIIDFLLDTTRAAYNLAVMGVLTRFPNIKFILSHSGGFLPFAAYRMAGSVAHARNESILKGLRQFQKFYVDTALSSSPSALPSTLQFVPNNQITYGSDYPYAPTFAIQRFLNVLQKSLANEQARDLVNFHAANGLLKKPLAHWRTIWHQDTGAQEQ